MGKVLPAALAAGAVRNHAGAGRRRRPRGGIAHARHALQQKPGDSWLVIAQAQVHMQIADFARALGLLDGALASATTATDRRTALYYRGHANFNLGQYAQSADDFDASLAGRTTLEDRGWDRCCGATPPRSAPSATRAARSPRTSATRTSTNGPARSRSSCSASCRPASSRSWPNPTTPPSAATASARPPSSSAWTPSGAATSSGRASSSSSPRRAVRRCPNSTGPRRASSSGFRLGARHSSGASSREFFMIARLELRAPSKIIPPAPAAPRSG